METLWQDLRFGWRLFLNKPAFTLIAVLSLALGIGANTAIFSLVDAVLLRPLPFHEPDRLAIVWEDAAQIGFPRNTPAPANYADWKAQNKVFEDMAAINWRNFALTENGEPEKVEAQAVTANFFSLLGVKPLLGRSFTAAEDAPGADRVALISYGLWQRRFGSDPALVGKEILLDGQKRTVLGVMPAGFQLLSKETGLWVPMAFSAEDLANRGGHYLTVVARIKPGVTLAQARADIAGVMQRINQDHPMHGFELGSVVIPLREELAGEVRPALIVLLVAVGCVLLIACANIANLLLSRGAARYREIAVRTALGAGRGRIVRQLLTESILLAVAGGLTGLLFAWLSFSFLTQIIPDSMALNAGVKIDARIFSFTMLLSLLTGIVFGLAPAMQAAKVDLNEALKQSGGRSGAGAGHRRLRSALVVTEIALALVLLVGAGLLIQTFLKLRALDIGINAENVLTLRTQLPSEKYGELPKRTAFYQQVLERVRALPGVRAAGYTTAVPLTWKGGTTGFVIEGKTPQPGQDANNRQVTTGYFETMGVKLRQGRFFDEHDNAQSQPVVIINETMARQYWPGESAVGKRINLEPEDPASPWRLVVGVIADVKEMGLEAPPKAETFFPFQQLPTMLWNMPRDLTVRTSGDPMNPAAAVRQAVWSVDPAQPVSNVRTMEDILSEEVAQRRIGMTLLAAFAALALLLASLGIYGVLSYAVTQRTQEIGVRMALGANRRAVVRMVMTDGLRLAGAGVVLGLGASFALTRLMANLLFGVSANDPRTLALVTLLLTAVAMLACYVPARRAAKVDPMVALRYE
ncbi:MAG TPA: ABC transporter permease [Blastocatellia bacterium]|nr:ABC transporter permease [Blastocatellia bacterium]HMZ20725.1 ABC transporter permease [Blastocatellia bacterium]HNG33226.1 ABC transporter permease [Blastocatellia bacterium]